MTLAAFLTALSGLDVSGVVTEYSRPPLSLNTAHLPAQWVQIPELTDEISRTMAQHGGLWSTESAQLVVALEAVGQGDHDTNYDASIAMMDNVKNAIINSASKLGRGKITYHIRQGTLPVAGNDYWVVIAEVTIRG